MVSEYPQSIPSDPSEMLDLNLGYPPVNCLPIKHITKAATEFLHTIKDPYFYMYGDGVGYASFRSAIVNLLSKRFGEHMDPGNIMITNGASGAIDLLCKRCTKPGDVVLTEDPTYFLVQHIFEDFGLKVYSVPMNFRQKPSCGGGLQHDSCTNAGVNKKEKPAGVDLDELERLVILHKPVLFYTIPIGHNPTGVTTTLQVREKVIDLAIKYNFKVVADEVYQFLAFDDNVPPSYAMMSLARLESDDWRTTPVVSVNSFSKVLAPALRLGWIQTSRSLIYHLSLTGLIQSGGGLNPFVSGLVHWLIDHEKLLSAANESRNCLKEKAQRMMLAMKSYFPKDVEWYPPNAGYFIIVQLPPWLRSDYLLAECLKKKVKFLIGKEFSFMNCPNTIRLSFSFYEPEEFEEGIKKIGQAIQELREKNKKKS